MKDIIYTERGGIRVGDHEDWFNQINATWPFARLILSKDFLEISYPWKKCFRFSREEIHAIEFRWGFPSNGIRIHHSKQEAPVFFVFWSFRSRQLLELLKENGYRVGDGHHHLKTTKLNS